MHNADLTVSVFEDNAELRESIENILNASQGFSCIGAYANCKKVIEVLNKKMPGIVLMDIQMPGISGIEAVSVIKNKFPDLPVVMHTVFDDDGRVFAAICAGANGYILKSITPEKLLEALKDAKDGGAPMTPSVAAKVLQTFAQQSKTKKVANPPNLSQREHEILKLLSDGLSYKLIAANLFINYETVHSHIKNIYQKLHVNSINEAVSIALKNKIV